MLFNHDTEHWLECVVDLVNSIETATTDELLPDVDALRTFVRQHDISATGRLTEQDLDQVHTLRTAIAAVFDATTDWTAASAVNALVSRAAVTPRLTDHDGHPWHLHYDAPGATLTEHLTIDCGMALAQVVAAGERERLRRCAAPDCEQVLVDLSRNRSKRYCDARTCGNRLHVAAYRERQRAAGA
jgi:predicted RNA-binding Zn ribbon-like protein